MGPGAGLHGGEVVFNGKPKQITRSKIQLRALIYQEKEKSSLNKSQTYLAING